MSIPSITPEELHARQSRGGRGELIDVRTPAEFRASHAAGARLIPLDRLDPAAVLAARAPADVDQPLYVICRSGSRGRQACERFAAAGFRGAVNVEGGTAGWARAGLPVVRGQTTISLERQVRIAAGALVVLGVALGVVVHPYLLGIAGVVGVGLVFAGVTDTCGMGLALARMPWNRGPSEPAACATDRPAAPGAPP